MRSPILAALCLATLTAQTAPLPSFEDFPVAQRYRGKIAAPQFTKPAPATLLPDGNERARENVELEAESGPNFAGHYTLAKWGCGTGCFRIIVVDAVTGKLFRDVPFQTMDIGYDTDTEEHKYGGMTFRAASSLFVAEGCFDGLTDCGRRYYRWEAPRFLLLKSIPAADKQ